MLENKLTRRTLLGLVGSEILLSACQIFNKEQGSFPDLREKSPIDGDIIALNNKHFLLVDNLAHEIQDFEKYKKLTKFQKYGGRTFQVGSVPSAYKVKSFTRQNEKGVVDIYTGDWKDPKFFGGEINVFFPGFMTDGGVLHDTINPSSETFYEIRKGLSKNNWELLDTFFFTYGDKGFDEYKSKNTALDPKENINKAFEFFNYLKKEFPLARFNLIGHSLGGLFAFEAARQSPNYINNLILIDSPVLGLKDDKSNIDKVDVFKRAIRPIIGEEKVSDFLFERWNYRKEIEDFIKLFLGSGKKLTDIYSDDDPIVPTESKILQGARLVSISVGSAVDSPLLGYLQAHGRALTDSRIVTIIADIIGENEARNV